LGEGEGSGVVVGIGVGDRDTVMSERAWGTTPKDANVAAASVLLVYIGQLSSCSARQQYQTCQLLNILIH